MTATKSRGRALVKTDARGWYIDATDPEGGKVRKQDGDEIYENLVEAQTAQAVLDKAHGPGNGAKPAPQTTMAPTGKTLVGKTITIKCKWRGCKNTRVIKPQDAFQVRFCVEHQKEHRKEVLKQKRQAKAKARKEARAAAKA